MRILPNGRVGIGTSAPANTLQVNGTTLMGSVGSVYGFFVPDSSPGPYPTLGFNTYNTNYLAGVAGYGGVLQFQDGDGKLIYFTGSNVAAGTAHVNTPPLAAPAWLALATAALLSSRALIQVSAIAASP
jgi:hypothetical protein